VLGAAALDGNAINLKFADEKELKIDP